MNSRSSKVHRSLRSVIKITQIRFCVIEKVDGLLMKWIPFMRRPTTKVIIAAGICYSRNGHVSMNLPLIFCKATELDRRVHKGLKWEVHGITNLQLILSRTIHSWVDSLHKHQCLVCAAYGSKFTSILLGRLKFEVIMTSPHYHQLYGDTL